MKKKKLLVFATAVTISAAAGVLSIGLSSNRPMPIRADQDTTWMHYSGVSATTHKLGIKEYWVNCDTHEHQFTEPSGTVIDGGTPSTEFINSLEKNDDRLIGRYEKVIDFEEYEDGTTKNGGLSYFTRNDATFTIVEGKGVKGSKALKLTNSRADGAMYIDISSAFLKAVFDKSDVKSLSFYAKAETDGTNLKNFKSRHGSGQSTLFEQNADGFGMSTEYKVFYLTRSVYDLMVSANDYQFLNFEPGGTNSTVYLDDFKVCYLDYSTYTHNGFENGRYYKNSDTNWIYRHAKNNQADFQITSSDVNVVGESTLDYDLTTEGVASIKTVKANSGQINFVFGSASNFKPANLPDEGIYFDFRTNTTWNASWYRENSEGEHYIEAGSVRTGVNGVMVQPFDPANFEKGKGIQLSGNAWHTFHLSKSDITTDGRFFILPGGGLGTVYADNIRFANEPIDSFESAYAYTGGLTSDVHAGASSYPLSSSIGVLPQTHSSNDYIFAADWGSETSYPKAEITDEFASHGDYSLKLTLPDSKPLRVRPSYLRMILEGGSLSFDVYTEDLPDNKLSLTTLAGTVKPITKGKWTTITLTKEDFATGENVYHQEGRFTTKAFGKGTVYIDNIRYNAE